MGILTVKKEPFGNDYGKNKDAFDNVKVDSIYLQLNGTATFEEENMRYCITEPIKLVADTTYNVGNGSILYFFNDGKITTDEENPATLMFSNSTIDASFHQIFDLNVMLGGLLRNEAVYPEWWGAKGDGVTDDAEAINLALHNAGHVPVVLTAENYLVKSTVGVKESENVNMLINAAYNYESDGKSAGSDVNALRWDATAPTYNTGHTIIVKHKLIGDSSLNGTVLEMDECGTTVRVEGAIVVMSPSDNAVGVSVGVNGLTSDSGNGYGDIYINRITRDYNSIPYYNVTTSAAHVSHYNLGKGIGCMFVGYSSRLTINEIFGFKSGLRMDYNVQCCDIHVGQISAIYPLHIKPSGTGGYITRNTIRLDWSQTDSSLGGTTMNGLEWITNIADSAIIFEDFVGTKRCEVAMNSWLIGDSNKAPQCPQNYALYYNRTSGGSNHTGNKYTFNVSFGNIYGENNKRIYFHQGTSAKSVGDEIYFGVGMRQDLIDVAGYVWNMKMHNIYAKQTATNNTNSMRWGIELDCINYDFVTFTSISAPTTFSNELMCIIHPNEVYSLYAVGNSQTTCADKTLYYDADNAINNTLYPIYAKVLGTTQLLGYMSKNNIP